MKPYAILVQCIPSAGLSDAKVRQLLNKLIEQMTIRGMKIRGELGFYIHVNGRGE